jgi:hypothetical protein
LERSTTSNTTNKRLRVYQEQEHYLPNIQQNDKILTTPVKKSNFGNSTYASATCNTNTTVSTITSVPTTSTEEEPFINMEVNTLKETVKDLQNEMKLLSHDTNEKIEIAALRTNKNFGNIKTKLTSIEEKMGGQIKKDMSDMLKEMTLSINTNVNKQIKKKNQGLDKTEYNMEEMKNNKVKKNNLFENVITRSKTLKHQRENETLLMESDSEVENEKDELNNMSTIKTNMSMLGDDSSIKN